MATTKKKTPTKKTTPKKSSKRPEMRSFKRAPEPTPFMTWKATHQTLYWLVICLFTLGIGIWMISLNIKVQKIYDEAEQHATIEQYQKEKHD